MLDSWQPKYYGDSDTNEINKPGSAEDCWLKICIGEEYKERWGKSWERFPRISYQLWWQLAVKTHVTSHDNIFREFSTHDGLL